MAEPTGYGRASWLQSAPYLIFRANTVVHRRLQEALESLGVSISQWGILEHIDEFGMLSASDIARGIRLTPQSINTAVGLLESRGLIVRRRHAGHGRIVLWELTAEGRDVVHAGRERVAVVRAEVDAALAQAGLATVVSGLAELVETLDGPQDDARPRWTEGGPV